MEVHGVGPAKLDEYGEDILELVLAAPISHPRSENEPAAVPNRAVGRPRRDEDHASPSAQPVDEDLLAALENWRAERAKDLGLPVYILLTNRSLEGIAATRPRSEVELLEVHGVGPAKLERYGEEVLELVREHTGD